MRECGAQNGSYTFTMDSHRVGALRAGAAVGVAVGGSFEAEADDGL